MSMLLACVVLGDEDVSDYNYAIVEVDKAYLIWLRSCIRHARRISRDYPGSGLYAMSYFDANTSYYKELSIEDDEDLDHGEFRDVTNKDFSAKASDALPTTATTVVITTDSVYWQGHPKHGGAIFETESLTREQLNELIKQCPAE